MTEINFYVSKEEGLNNRLMIVNRLIGIAVQRKLSIHVHTSNVQECKTVDDFLWNHQKTSFIPHRVIFSKNIDNNTDTNVEKNQLSEVSIGHDFEPMVNCDYLINLSSKRPEFFSRYLKFAEIIDTSEEILTAGRKRYAFYRDRGYTLEYHQL